MKEAYEKEMEDFSLQNESNDALQNYYNINSNNNESLQGAQGLIGQENEEELMYNQPLPSLNDKLTEDYFDSSLNSDSFPSDSSENNDIVLAKKLYMTKEFIFMFVLIAASGLNFSWLYFPLQFLAFISYFLLYKSSNCTKKFKIFIEILAVIYGLCLLGFKIFLIAIL